MATQEEHEKAQRDYVIYSEVLRVRDMLKPIIDGEIERGHCVGRRECYGGTPGMRKTMLADAKRIARHCEAALHRLAQRITDDDL